MRLSPKQRGGACLWTGACGVSDPCWWRRPARGRVGDAAERVTGAGLYGGRAAQVSVTVYLPVKKPGQYGECPVYIIDWDDGSKY